MRIRLIAIGQKMPEWVQRGFFEYHKRIVYPIHFELIEIAADKRLQQATPALIEREGQRLLAAVKPDHHLIALDQRGQGLSTLQLADYLKQWLNVGKNVDWLVGGPDGLSPQCLQQAKMLWSLSPLTLPHPLVRVLVAEQLYRAQSILLGHPYHR